MPSNLGSRNRDAKLSVDWHVSHNGISQHRLQLPDSLFVTVSVLFAWVDLLDLIAVLQVSLRVVAMEKLFQQEELTRVSFLLRGGRCYMEERMYRAQMEVTLFSKAIANLCEEFNTKCRPCKPCCLRGAA
jgi:hypothetical protein